MAGTPHANGPQFRVRSVHEASHRRQLHLRDGRAQWWTRRCTVVAGVLRHTSRDNGHVQLDGYRTACHKLLGDVPADAH
eukprot:7276085-Pyramimonas_sp.AAC.1